MIVTTKKSMSKAVAAYLEANPVLTRYLQNGLINITALALSLQNHDSEVFGGVPATTVSMAIRRYARSLAASSLNKLVLDTKQLSFVTRSNLTELIFVKNDEKRKVGLELFQIISRTKHFSCLVEGEQEIVLLTDYPVDELSNVKEVEGAISHRTKNLAFISINFSISLREVVGVYNQVTTLLAAANISIHAFHTIGGEILILVRNEDLLEAQRVLSFQSATI